MLFVSAVLICSVASSAFCEEPAAKNAENLKSLLVWPMNDVGPFVFHAVLEWLYTDGVSNEVVDKILKPDFLANFVDKCPLCLPAYQAFLLYRDRQPLAGVKSIPNKPLYDSFGNGLDEAVKQDILSGSTAERRKALQSLISQWTSRRLELMRLSPAELATWKAKFDQAREKGMEWLKARQERPGTDGLYEAYKEWEDCATCEGAFGACEVVKAKSAMFSPKVLTTQDN
jgi:hypothetical protein